MTRVLSQLLNAEPMAFGERVTQLERLSGHPNADIRLTTELLHRTQAKIQELGLDPADTTAAELFGALLERLKHDEQTVRVALGVAEEATGTAIMAAAKKCIDQQAVPRSSFALKPTVLKRLLKILPPTTALRKLGYRSLDSALKREPIAQLLAAAWLLESAEWHEAWLEQCGKLTASDFEARQIETVLPTAKRWAKLGPELAAKAHASSLALPEVGTVVLLPPRADLPAVTLLALLFMFLQINDIHSMGAYLKLQQVQPDFGGIFKDTLIRGAFTSANLVGEPLPWRLLQRYWSDNNEMPPELLTPQVQAEDLSWRQAETELGHAIPALEFWADTSALGLIDGAEIVSLNVFDVALSLCNRLSFADRVTHFLRDSVWHELLLKYLKQPVVEEAVVGQLDKLADPEAALV